MTASLLQPQANASVFPVDWPAVRGNHKLDRVVAFCVVLNATDLQLLIPRRHLSRTLSNAAKFSLQPEACRARRGLALAHLCSRHFRGRW